jgi:hypothetical protein
MKTIFNRIALVLLITSLASVSVFPKSKKATVNFPTNIKVNGTLVSKGVYDLRFDDKTGELSIMNGDKVIAKAMTTVSKRDRKARALELRTAGSGDEEQLTGVAFSGSGENLMINGSQASR